MYGSYAKTVFDAAVGDASLATAIELEATTGAKLTKTMNEPFVVTRFGFRPTVAFDYDTQTAEGVLTLYRYPVAGGAGKVALATIPLQDDAVANGVYYVDVSNPIVAARKMGRAEINAGEQVVIEVSTRATGGGYIAGDYQPFFAGHHKAEVAGNQTLMTNLSDEDTIAGT
jgi:hypothetical protein